MANINIYGTLNNVTGETIVKSSQIIHNDIPLSDILDEIYIKTYDYTKDIQYEDVTTSSLTYDNGSDTTIINGIVSINVPKTQTYCVEIQAYLPNVIYVVDGKYFALQETTTMSFPNTNNIKFQFIGDAYIKKITVRSGNNIPNKLSDLLNDVDAKTILVDSDNETLNINNI